jgi:hypothetical protein
MSLAEPAPRILVEHPLPVSGPAAGDAGTIVVSRLAAADYVAWTAPFEALNAESAAPNPFLSPAVVAATRAFAPDDEIVILAAHAQQEGQRRCVGLWCLRLVREIWTLWLPVLQAPLKPDFEPLSHPLLARGSEREVLAALLGFIERERHLPGVVRVHSLPAAMIPLLPAHVAVSFAERWQRAVFSRAEGQPECPEQALKAMMGSSCKKRLAQERALARLGMVSHASLRGQDALAAVEAFIALEASGWKGRKGSALASHPHDAAYVRHVVQGLAQADRIAVDMICLDGEPVAIGLLPEAAGLSLFWKTAFDERHGRHSPGVLLDMAVTRRLLAEGRPALDSGMMEFTDPDGQIWPGRLDLCRAALDIRHGLDGRVLRAGKQARFALRRLKARLAR